jgi:hypothetical protein
MVREENMMAIGMGKGVLAAALAAVLSTAAAASGCGKSDNESRPEVGTATTGAGQAAPSSGPTGDVTLTFKSEPDPPRTGENRFEVTVTGSGGTPVTDAEVAAEFYMPAMPSMNMPEMRNSVVLAHEGGGRYMGTGNVVMAGAWDVTITAKRAGSELGRRTFAVMAK